MICLIALLCAYAWYVYSTPRIIGTNYMTRYFIIPRNRWFNVYLHRYTGSDDDRALHDHPWKSVSFLLKGRITEILEDGINHPPESEFDVLNNMQLVMEGKIKRIKKFKPVVRSPEHKHRLCIETKTAWTIFMTGPKVRDWGFHCNKGWVHWRDFTDPSGNKVGRGCE